MTIGQIRLPFSYITEFVRDGRTPMRALSDLAVVEYAKYLSQSVPEILELGSGADYYKNLLASIIRVKTSNISSGCDLVLDMTDISLPSNSQNAVMSFFAGEHVFDYEKSFQEVHRILSPNGYYFVILPFLYFYHGAPDDFFRFSGSALRSLALKHGFTIDGVQALGDRNLLFAEFLHEKAELGSNKGKLSRLVYRLLALPFLFRSIFRHTHDETFAMGFACLLRKAERQ